MANNDSQLVSQENKANGLPEGFDWLNIAKHFAKHTAMEMANLSDAIKAVERDEIKQGYKSGFIQLDALGNATIELKDTTRTVILQKQGGYLDSTTVQLGDFKFTYPSKEVEIDCLHLPSFSQVLKLSGNAGDSYIVTQSTIPDLLLSDVIKGFSNLNGSVQVTNTPNVQLSGSNEVIIEGHNDNNGQPEQVSVNNVPADGEGGQAHTLLYTFNRNSLYNGSGFDMARNNTQGTLLASAARTANVNSPIMTNFNHRGVLIVVTVSTITGTSASLEVQLVTQSPVDGGSTAIGLTSTSTAITVPGTSYIVCYPAPLNQSGSGSGIITNWQTVLPRTWSAAFIVGGTTPSITFDASYYGLL